MQLLKRHTAVRHVPDKFACYFGLGKVSIELSEGVDFFKVSTVINYEHTINTVRCLTANRANTEFQNLLNQNSMTEDDVNKWMGK